VQEKEDEAIRKAEKNKETRQLEIYHNHLLDTLNDAGLTKRIREEERSDKLLPLPQPPVRARTDAQTNPTAQRATQLRSVLARVYAVSIQNQITTTVK
jgi:hypothetical protein